MRSAAVDPRQTSFVVAVADVLSVVSDEMDVCKKKLSDARRAADYMTASEMTSALTALSSIRDKVSRLSRGAS